MKVFRVFPSKVLAILVFVCTSLDRVEAGVNKWTFHGPFGANVFDVYFHPTDKNLIFAKTWHPTREWNVFRSTNEGRTWELISRFGQDFYFPSGPVLVHPQRPDLLISPGVISTFTSTDRGSTWQVLAKHSFGFNLHDMKSHPLNPDVIYASVGCKLFKSSDGARTWENTSSGIKHGKSCYGAIAVAPNDGDVVYWAIGKKVFKTINGGNSWIEVTNGLVLGDTLEGNYSFGINPHDPGELYIGSSKGIYQTTNGGQTWSPNRCNCHPFSVAVDQTDPKRVYAVGEKALVSDDRAKSWKEMKLPLAPVAVQNTLNFTEIYRSVKMHPLTGKLFVGQAETGIHTSADQGKTWDFSSGGMFDVGISRIVVNPNKPGQVLALDRMGRVHETRNGGLSWDFIKSLRANRFSDIQIHPNNANLMVGASINSIWITTNGGKVWQTKSPYEACDTDPVDCQVTIALDPGDQKTLFVLPHPGFGGSRITRKPAISKDLGNTWNLLTNELFDWFGFNRIVIDTKDSKNIFLTGVRTRGAGRLKFFRSIDGGATWKKRTLELYNMVADPVNPKTWYAALLGNRRDEGRGFAKSVDNGETWVVNPDILTSGSNFIYIDPDDPRIIFAGPSGDVPFLGPWVRYTVNGGETWNNFDTNGLDRRLFGLAYPLTFTRASWSPYTFFMGTERSIYVYTWEGPRPSN